MVWAVREGQDGRLHQPPHPRVPLLLAATQTQVWDLTQRKQGSGLQPGRGPEHGRSGGRTFRTTWTKSLGERGRRPCSWRVQASRDAAWATISTLFPTKGGSKERSQDQTMRPSFFQMLRRRPPLPTGCLGSPGNSGSCNSHRARTQRGRNQGSAGGKHHACGPPRKGSGFHEDLG